MKEKEIVRRTRVAHDVNDRIFSSIQLAAYYTLYYDQDFSKQQIKNFNRFLRELNDEYKTYERSKVQKLSDDLKKNTGLDCRKMAVDFPYRIKMKMYGKPLGKDAMIVVNNATDCIEGFLILGVTVLRRHYRFSAERIREWYGQMVEFTRLYVEGMKDSHVVEYFKLDCELEITK